MRQLDFYRFYELGSKLHGLFCADAQGRVADMFAPLTEAQALLDGLIKGDGFALDTSKADANKLLAKISSLFNRYFIDPATKQLKAPAGEDRVDAHEMSMIRTMIEKFEHALAAELNRAPTYAAEKCGIYSTRDLAENARNVFAEALRPAMPGAALDEFDSAGRALAFGFGTAAAVHMLRAVEVTLKIYYESFAGPVTAKTERNYGMYLKKLAALVEDDDDKQPHPDKRVVQMLTQIKDYYRNPLLTPETSLSNADAAQLFGLASALISLMAEHLVAAGRKTEKGKSNVKPLAAANAPASDDEDYAYRISQVG